MEIQVCFVRPVKLLPAVVHAKMAMLYQDLVTKIVTPSAMVPCLPTQLGRLVPRFASKTNLKRYLKVKRARNAILYPIALAAASMAVILAVQTFTLPAITHAKINAIKPSMNLPSKNVLDAIQLSLIAAHVILLNVTLACII